MADVEIANTTAEFDITVQQLQQLVQPTSESTSPDITSKFETPESLARELHTSLLLGLTSDPSKLEQRRAIFGTNRLPEAETVTFLELLIEASSDPTLALLFVSGVISLVLAFTVSTDGTDWIEGSAILGSALIVVLVSAVTNYQKEAKFRQLNSLKEDIQVRVVRGGQEQEISTFELLVGDVVLVETGDILPADGILFQGGELKVDESHLTGESDEVVKALGSSPILMSGSKIREGFGHMLVLAVGPNSQQGIINTLVMGGGENAAAGGDNLREETMLVKKLDKLAKDIGQFGVAAASAVFVVNTFGYSLSLMGMGIMPFTMEHAQQYLEFFITSITILVVAVPEGLPLAVTLALAFSVQRMLADNNLVRHLNACETMAGATTICSDKTGTLTENKMKVARIWAAGLLYNIQRSSSRGPVALEAIFAGAVANGNGAAHGNGIRNGNGNSGGGGLAASPRPPSAATALEAEAAIMSAAAALERAGGVGTMTNTMTLISLSLDESDPGLGSMMSTEGAVARSPGLGLGMAANTRDLLFKNIALNSTASMNYSVLTGTVTHSGNRTECALLDFMTRLGGSLPMVESLRSTYPVLQSFPFTSVRKRSSVLVAGPKGEDGAPVLMLFTKGAAEMVVERCVAELTPTGEVMSMDPKEKLPLLKSFSRDGLRMLALAYREIPGGGVDACALNVDDTERGLVLLGLVGMEDPLRPEVPEAIRQCQRAGIAVRMLTGDNPMTATAIARQCGILPPDIDPEDAGLSQPVDGVPSPSASLSSVSSMLGADAVPAPAWGANGSATGAGAPPPPALPPAVEWAARLVGWRPPAATQGAPPPPTPDQESSIRAVLKSLPEDADVVRELTVLEARKLRKLILGADGKVDHERLLAVWPHLRVIARCTPADKYMLVRALRKMRDKGMLNEVVAVTGDGTNDAPALTAADVGFAMNSGTSIAKDASDILLMDDNFASIVSAVKWGRNVYASITKFLQFQLTANVVAVATACAGALALQESPLSAVQMLWVNLIMDSLASLSLATEAPSDAMLDLRPIPPDQGIVTPTVIKHVVGQALFQLSVLYVLVFHGRELLHVDKGVAYTMVFNTFVQMQLFNQLNCRKVRDEVDVLEGITHHPPFTVILATEFLLQVLIVQYGGRAFETSPLTLSQWGLSIGIGALTLGVRQVLRALPTEAPPPQPLQPAAAQRLQG